MTNNVFNFEFKSTVKEITIGGETFSMNFDDDSLMDYMDGFKSYADKIETLKQNAPELSTATEEQLKEMKKSQTEILAGTIDMLLGEGKFKVVYELAGKSSMQIVALIDALMQMVQDELGEQSNGALDRYLKR
ncbi:Uncharacterised protein [Streptococcus pneumoniae]|uniref:hypothetical protein n=3 Tax=Streptococcus pneumoniae TaxID=1313 RepID=UPI0005E362B5|nr:hypothetical protein [Streptococcus pneumoniae]CAG7568857.1 Uncharacterised protein [Streptococcus pneumoniae]CEV40759.1 Uncharacterised protein [Streptococcus pneumoniae]CEY70501.1 Uncharacterised protein [Streptococcus pneumoniae]CGG49735.1 Uncharacterised protein [Streptococcus pneumoniae]CGG53040.1 Uncharacterised protein [Streptococcus pneumoniae]